MKKQGISILRQYWLPFVGTTAGCLISGFAIAVFYHHSKLISGGITGIAMILNYQLGWNTLMLYQ